MIGFLAGPRGLRGSCGDPAMTEADLWILVFFLAGAACIAWPLIDGLLCLVRWVLGFIGRKS